MIGVAGGRGVSGSSVLHGLLFVLQTVRVQRVEGTLLSLPCMLWWLWPSRRWPQCAMLLSVRHWCPRSVAWPSPAGVHFALVALACVLYLRGRRQGDLLSSFLRFDIASWFMYSAFPFSFRFPPYLAARKAMPVSTGCSVTDRKPAVRLSALPRHCIRSRTPQASCLSTNTLWSQKQRATR